MSAINLVTYRRTHFGETNPSWSDKDRAKKVLTLFGTRPEAVKLAPIIRRLESCDDIQTLNITSAQHTDLLYPFLELLRIRVDYNLQVMEPNQTLNGTTARILASLDAAIDRERPDLVLVQGDTTTAFAGALAAFHRGIPVGHVEAGLRSGNPGSPFPEETNRRLVTRLATYHFAPTPRNRETLLAEGIDWRNIFVTGNTVVDSLNAILENSTSTPRVQELLAETEGLQRIVLTAHRRESFGREMLENFEVLRRFVAEHKDVALIFPVHPNPAVVRTAQQVFRGQTRIRLIKPLGYADFIKLLSNAWLIVSDSGGIQEEAPSLGKPLLILRENTERPEVLESGIARLVGGCPRRLAAMLDEAHAPESWVDRVKKVKNPFGKGDSGERITRIIERLFKAKPEAGSRKVG
ncbi:MAG TPA: UDP-N-acetylglucosamine 2-epimerase (non-hydrolyzing) [Pyrinomonadaceae bacterium]|nr:UDP-N-acetylglucosamine 2-epimerase (non-hydrolyzing) [Pyrinomonadaceae bacterium]